MLRYDNLLALTAAAANHTQHSNGRTVTWKLRWLPLQGMRPTVDQVDAMLCAIAAEACVAANGLPPGSVGQPPFVDEPAQVIREGYIVSP